MAAYSVHMGIEQQDPRMKVALARMRGILASLPPQTDDPGVMDELKREHEEFAELRARANRLTL